jgi:hypothetical protein
VRVNLTQPGGFSSPFHAGNRESKGGERAPASSPVCLMTCRLARPGRLLAYKGLAGVSRPGPWFIVQGDHYLV